jgi:gamma-glutamylcyclotransferase (GGCT)/AIG2-like uncharacterized protein YtfP
MTTIKLEIKMNTIRQLLKISSKHDTKIRTRDKDKYWRGADLIICPVSSEREWIGQDEPIFHEQSATICRVLKRVLKVLWNDKTIGYNYITKYQLIRDLVFELPEYEPGKELVRRAISLTLKTHETMLYFAYGSNMDLMQMRDRCPRSEYVGNGKLSGFQFIINSRGVASIAVNSDRDVEGMMFEVTEACTVKLDRYEGVGEGYYEKCFVSDCDSGVSGILAYVASDNVKGFVPRNGYFERIIASAIRTDFSVNYLEELKIYFLECGLQRSTGQ